VLGTTGGDGCENDDDAAAGGGGEARGEAGGGEEMVEAVPGANSYSDESAFLTRVSEVDGLSIAQLACSLERAGVYCGAGVTKEAMQCALKANMSGRADNTTAAEVFDEFAAGRQELGKQELSMVCATLGNLLDADGLDDLFFELDEDGNGSVSRAEFELWWDVEVAPNQEINRRAAALERFKAEAAGARSLVLGPPSRAATTAAAATAAAAAVPILTSCADTHGSCARSRCSCVVSWFVAGWGEGELSVAEVFGRLDTDGSGTLDRSEVEQLAAALGVILSQSSAAEMFAEVRSRPLPAHLARDLRPSRFYLDPSLPLNPEYYSGLDSPRLTAMYALCDI